MKIPAREFQIIQDYLPAKVENTFLGARFQAGGNYYILDKRGDNWVLFQYLGFDFTKKIKKLGRNLDIALVNLWNYIKDLEL